MYISRNITGGKITVINEVATFTTDKGVPKRCPFSAPVVIVRMVQPSKIKIGESEPEMRQDIIYTNCNEKCALFNNGELLCIK